MITKVEDIDLVSSRLGKINNIIEEDGKFLSYIGENSKNYLDMIMTMLKTSLKYAVYPLEYIQSSPAQ